MIDFSIDIYDASGVKKINTSGSLDLTSPPPIGTTTPNSGYFSTLRLKLGGFFGIFSHANSSDRTYTLPDATTTLLGHDTSQTVSNKTFAGTSPFTGLVDINTGTMRLPVNASALTATEGHGGWDSTNKRLRVHNGVREVPINAAGYLASAYPFGLSVSNAFSSAFTRNPNDTIIMQIILAAAMDLESVSILNRDTTLARTWGWDLYVDLQNNSNTLNRVATGTTNDTFTASAVSVRTLAASATVKLAPGVYWLAVQNRHATNTFQFGAELVGGTFAPNRVKIKNTGGTNGATLDIVAATWTGTTSLLAAVLNGSVAGNAGSYF